MAFYDIARTKASYDSYVVLRGTFSGGTAGVWSTRHVKTTTGLLDGRMEVEPVESSLPETTGGEPERVNITVRLHNHDNAITQYVRGSSSSTASTEYRSASFMDFTGRLYLGVRDPADGALYEQALTPTLCLADSPKYDGFTVSLHLSSYDDRILGRSQIGFTVRDIRNSASGSAGSGDWIGRYTSGALTQAAFAATLAGITENLDETVPYLLGRQLVPLLRVGESVSSDKKRTGVPTYLAWASIKEPQVTGIDIGMASTRATSWPIFVGNRGEPLRELHRNWSSGDPPRLTFEVIQRSITNALGETFEAWLVFVKFQPIDEAQAERIDKEHLFLDPEPSRQGIVEPGGAISYHQGPNIINALVRDHSTVGASAVDSTSFSAAKGGIGLGLLYYPTEPIRTAIGKVARAGGYNLWIGVDDKLHIAAVGAFSSADKTTVAAGLTHITAADLIGDWDEELPFVAQKRGAPARRLVLNWSSEQRKFWDNDGKARYLLQEAPGVLVSFPELMENLDDEIPGDAIYPPLALSLLTAAMLRRGFPRRRITAACRAWLGTVEKGTLYYLSHPRGLGDNSGGGYTLRLVRLESSTFMWGEDAARCVFEDLGPLADIKLGLLDARSNWTATDPTAADTITVTAGSRNVTCGAGNVRKFSAADVGRALITNGATNSGNRSSKRIATFNSATSVDVDAADATYSTNETITASGSGYDITWSILETQETKGSAYRPTRIRWCRESTGLFRDGTTAGYQFSIT